LYKISSLLHIHNQMARSVQTPEAGIQTYC
jgi:hypothetical protein